MVKIPTVIRSDLPSISVLCERIRPTMQLPYEIKSEILQLLGEMNHGSKTDFKAVRLVNKDWSACTSRFLFERIYLSFRDEDIKVFKSITNCPDLAACIKELVFDGSCFVGGVSKRKYFEDLCMQIFEINNRQIMLVSTPSFDLSLSDGSLYLQKPIKLKRCLLALFFPSPIVHKVLLRLG